MALTEIKTSGIADDAITTDKLANAINTERTANTAKVSLGADAVTGAKIADDAVGAEHIEVLDSHLQLADSCNVKIGTGDDLQIYHDGSHSYLKNSTGRLRIQGDDVRIEKADGSEFLAKFTADGAAELYHDDSKKLETRSGGLGVFGHIEAGDSQKLMLGDSNDLQIYHDGTGNIIDSDNGYLDIICQNNTNGLRIHTDGTVNIGQGVDGHQLRFGAGDDLKIYHTGSHAFQINSTGNTLYQSAEHAFYNADASTLLAAFRATGSHEVKGSDVSFKAPDGGNRYFFGEMGNSASAQLSLYDSSDSQKVRISAHSSDATFFNATSNFLIHCTSISGSAGRVYTNRGSSDTTTLEVNQNAGGSTEMITFRKDGSQLGTIHQSGSGVAYQSASDYRLKQDDAAISDGIARVKQLRPIRFKWKSDTDKTVDGFFAHEVSSVVPESVRGNKDEVFDTDGVGTQVKGGPKYQQLDQSKIVPLLTAALKEAITKIETLETKVAALEAG